MRPGIQLFNIDWYHTVNLHKYQEKKKLLSQYNNNNNNNSINRQDVGREAVN